MIDYHSVPSGDWGILPLIKFGAFNIPSYELFVGLAIFSALIMFYLDSRKQKSSGNTAPILIAALFGGVLGAKLPIWVFHFQEIVSSFPDIGPILSGRTIVGGLIGGTLAVIFTKKFILKTTERRGNVFAPAIALGIAIGRIGCFLKGCCYGIATSLTWGVNFGDGIMRHPTQIYESIFALAMFAYLQRAKKKDPAPGSLFTILMVFYFSFRFLLEFIRVEAKIFLGLSGFQWASLLVLGYYAFTERASLNKFIKKWFFVK